MERRTILGIASGYSSSRISLVDYVALLSAGSGWGNRRVNVLSTGESFPTPVMTWPAPLRPSPGFPGTTFPIADKRPPNRPVPAVAPAIAPPILKGSGSLSKRSEYLS
ncbi:hypothetical protein FA13DRAFT_1006158 [Coprinellus micaceus]|uniref:Uncharacterized protein n=1 Tax=Coprinellus micaceus TaxID=71717 RepID=A0A4Y7RPX3_COPMI|nr:hypothetical protein FA13DRAFT_1006158 [Coprinellus micaceus]